MKKFHKRISSYNFKKETYNVQALTKNSQTPKYSQCSEQNQLYQEYQEDSPEIALQ